MKIKWFLTIICFLSVFALVGCGSTVEQGEEAPNSNENLAGGTMLAGEEAPEIKGILKIIEESNEVIITVDSQDIVYRLSERAIEQVKEKIVEPGNEVTFTTFSIGDDKESIAEFIVEGNKD
ncbi:hypothetical protein [Lysinibacillus sp. BW-2-10]|uniref:hypothetical protein n=1 Tax=Lysinibacillus sp. BW-2-10 TaxID=2590030 RepID=UPI00117D909F|nr:hypothetical protein [Lysinibacillus sp. BW-2-10]TSI03708.1 hypothetical protein FJQ64_15695 [Lysinibacillus sp. BW-2-10]